MPSTREIPPVGRLGLELLEVLFSVHLLRNPAPEADDYLSQMRNKKIVALLVNDIIIRIGKFREKSNRNLGFLKVAKLLGKTSAAGHAAAAASAIEEFMNSSIRLGNYRNLAVAHLSKHGTAELDPLVELYHLVGLAIRIVDILDGEKNEYRVGPVDLRKEVIDDEDV